jgi:hypothetical protein
MTEEDWMRFLNAYVNTAYIRRGDSHFLFTNRSPSRYSSLLLHRIIFYRKTSVYIKFIYKFLI